MSTADFAIAAVTLVSLAHAAADYRIRMRLADRIRIVSPPKAQQPETAAQAVPVPDIATRRTA